MMKLASHIIKRAQNTNVSITLFQLQKVMYFTLIVAFQKDVIDQEQLRDIYDIPFRVSRWGPKINEINEQYIVFGKNDITSEEEIYKPYNIFNPIIDDILKVEINDLIRECFNHAHNVNNQHTVKDGVATHPYQVQNLMNIMIVYRGRSAYH